MTVPHFRTLIAAAFGDDDGLGDRAAVPRRVGKGSPSPLPTVRPLLALDEEVPLLHRLRGDDEEIARSAFEVIYGAYASALWRFVLRLMSSPADAEEIVHDVFAQIWTRRTSWHPAGGVASYLFRAARNRAIDTHRHAAVAARIGDDPTLFPPEMGSPGMGGAPLAPDLVPVREELRQAVRAAVSALPERRRTALVLRYLHGMSYAQVAAVLGTTEKAAFILVARTRTALQPILQKFSEKHM